MRRIRALLALAVLAATIVFVFGPAGPANAIDPCPNGPHNPPCDWPMFAWPEADLCFGCPEDGMVFYDDRVLPAHDRKAYLADLDAGLDLLDEAARAGDAGAAAQLRAAAWTRFAAAGDVLDGATVKVGAIVTVDPQTGKTEPVPMPWRQPEPFPWLAAAGQHLTEGVHLLAAGRPYPPEAFDLIDAAHRKLTLAVRGPASAPWANFLSWEWDGDDCWCPDASIQFAGHPDVRTLDRLEEGLALLDRAARGTHPEPFPWLALAERAFVAAASGLDGAALSVAAVGPVDPKTGAVDPQPNPWLATAGAELAAGVNLLAAGPPIPEPAVVRQAMQHFQRAQAQLAAGKR
jgi:hypothetical protein